jgi:hypothetical protein
MNDDFIRESGGYGRVKDWHDPRNGGCAHNDYIESDCTCKRPRKAKGFKRVVVHDSSVGHNVSPNIVLEIWPTNGVVVLREKRRRKRYSTTTADIYAMLVRREALAVVAARREARKSRKQSRKGGNHVRR